MAFNEYWLPEHGLIFGMLPDWGEIEKMIMKFDYRKAVTNSSIVLALLLGGGLQAQNVVRYAAQPGGSKIKIEGTSSIHDWTVESRLVGGFMELDPAFDADLKTLATTPKVEATILVRQLKSGTKPMDNVMYDHMKLKEHPDIKYRLLTLAAKPGAPAGAASQFDATGELTVAGVTRTNMMPISMERVETTKILVKGATNLKMSDFKIEPPTISLLGIKTGDDVKLSFEWVTAKTEKPAETK